MPKKRIGARKRGRPRLARARRNETTRRGRRGEFVDDRGSEALRAHRLALTGREDLAADALGVLLGRELITNSQYSAGRDVGELLAAVSADFGGRVVASVWARILNGPVGGLRLELSGAAERALRILDRLRRRIGSQELTRLVFFTAEGGFLPSVVNAAVGKRLTTADRREIDQLGLGLERVSRSWSSGKATGAAAATA